MKAKIHAITIQETQMPAGRKRSFDDQVALQTAMELFWRQGYEGTSVADLTQALSINPPSLYAAFGSKRELFERALERYMCDRTVQMKQALSRPRLHEAISELLTSRVEAFTDPGLPGGCMTVQAGLSSGRAHEEIIELLTEARESMRRAVLERIDRAVNEGELSVDTECAALVRYVMAMLYGLSVEAASGVPKEELTAAAILAAQVVSGRWPSSS